MCQCRCRNQRIRHRTFHAQPFCLATDLPPSQRNHLIDRQKSVRKAGNDVIIQPPFQGQRPCITITLNYSFFQLANRNKGQIKRFWILRPQPSDNIAIRYTFRQLTDDARIKKKSHKSTALPKSLRSRSTSNSSPSSSLGQDNNASTKDLRRSVRIMEGR